MAEGTTVQASSIEELSAEINEIYTTIVNNAEYAENAGSKAMQASKEVEHGNMQMRDMLSAMDEISNSSSEIGKIIKVIDDIAFQTNNSINRKFHKCNQQRNNFSRRSRQIISRNSG